MHKLCIYKNPGAGWICEDLENRSDSSAHNSLNSLVNNTFAGYAGFLREKYDSDFSNARIKIIKDYLKNMFKHYQVVWIDFPGNLSTGEVIEKEIHPLHSANNLLFKL